MFDPRYQYSKDVAEFINCLQYLGGWRVVNFLRGPMNINQGKRGSLQKNHLNLINFGGPSDSTCNKQHAGYTVKSWVLGPLNLLTSEFLQNHTVIEVVISSVTTLDNAVSFPCSAEYGKIEKIGEIIKGKILSQIQTLQMCSCCQE